MAGDTPPATVINAALGHIIEDCAVQGLNGAILLFLRKRGLEGEPEKELKFAQLMTAEFGGEEEVKTYPLKQSIAQPVRDSLSQAMPVISLLHSVGEEDNLRKMIRVIVSGEMLTVMQNQLEDVMKVWNDL